MHSPVQGDFLLDIYLQCKLITKICRMQEEADASKLEQESKEIKELYQAAMTRMGDLCNDAVLHGLDEAEVQQIADDNLPDSVELYVTSPLGN